MYQQQGKFYALFFTSDTDGRGLDVLSHRHCYLGNMGACHPCLAGNLPLEPEPEETAQCLSASRGEQALQQKAHEGLL